MNTTHYFEFRFVRAIFNLVEGGRQVVLLFEIDYRLFSFNLLGTRSDFYINSIAVATKKHAHCFGGKSVFYSARNALSHKV